MNREREIIGLCLEQLGLNILASDVRTQTNWDIINGYIKIAVRKATQQNKTEIIDNLQIAGIIY